MLPEDDKDSEYHSSDNEVSRIVNQRPNFQITVFSFLCFVHFLYSYRTPKQHPTSALLTQKVSRGTANPCCRKKIRSRVKGKAVPMRLVRQGSALSLYFRSYKYSRNLLGSWSVFALKMYVRFSEYRRQYVISSHKFLFLMFFPFFNILLTERSSRFQRGRYRPK